VTDWGILQPTPNFVQSALSGYQVGRQLGKERRTEAALKNFGSDPEGSISQAYALDPALGESLSKRYARTLSGQALTMSATGVPMVEPSSLQNLMRYDPDQAMQIQQFASKATADQLRLAADHGQVKAQFAQYLRDIPDMAARQKAAQDLAPELAARGFRHDEIAQIDLSDHQLEKDIFFGRSLNDIIKERQPDVRVVPDGGKVYSISKADAARGGEIDLNNPAGGSATGEHPPQQGGFLTFDQYRSMSASTNFPRWQQQFGTPIEVTDESQFNSLPKGSRFVGPDHVVRVK
jgi:hypothetical protein